MKSLNIGFVFDDSMDRLDGVQQYINTLAEYYTSKGHKVFYFVGETKNSKYENLYSFSKNLRIRFNRNTVSIPYKSFKYSQIEKTLDALMIDVFHVQMPFSPIMSSKVIRYASKRGITVIGTFHILGYNKLQSVATKLLGVITKKSLNYFSKIYSISSPAQSFSSHYYGIKSDILGAPIDIKKFKSSKTLDYKSIDILNLGRLVKRKATIDLLTALKILRNKHPESYQSINSVKIAGSGYLSEKLQTYVKKNHLDDKISFLGFVSEEDKINLFANSQISVFPSRGGESFGIVLIEALSSGTTLVLAADNPGYRSVLGILKTQLFPVKNPDKLAEKLNYYINSPEKIFNSLNESRRIVKSYDVNYVGSKILSDIYSLIAKHKDECHNIAKEHNG